MASADSGNPFQSLLGDLMNMLGANAPDHWEMTRAFGVNVATGSAIEDNVEPVQRIRLEELSQVAELHVIDATGMPVSTDGQRLNCVPVGRGEWTLRALEAWRPVLTAMTPTAPQLPAPGAAGPGGTHLVDAPDDELGGLGNLLGQWALTIGPMFFGLQVGSVVGHLSHRALGQYVLALPWAPSNELLIVPANVTSFAEDWSLPEEEALLWVCAREMACHAVLSRPEIRHRMDELLAALATSSASTQQGLTDRLGGLGGPDGTTGMDLESLQGLFGDPESLLGDLLTPETRRTSDQLTAVAVVIDAYADHVADQIGHKLTGSPTQLAEAWYRRRIERGKGEEAAGALFGLDLEQAQVDRGRAFVSGVIARAGEDGLAKLWTSARHLPTPSEVDAPGLWLERISWPEQDTPGPSEGTVPPPEH
jgi:putative hydrolase